MKFFERKKKPKFSNFIYIKRGALPKSFCDNVIEKFEQDDRKRQGQVGSGVHLEIKRSSDLSITELEDWKSYDQAFFRCLNTQLKKYIRFLPEEYVKYSALNELKMILDIKYKELNLVIIISGIMIKQNQDWSPLFGI